MKAPTLSTILRTHADSMWAEGWYTVSMRMDEAADALDAAESNMTPKQYAAAIEALGLSQRAAGKFLGVDERTSRRWVSGDSAIPESAAKLLRLMIKLGLSPDDVR
jgi:DNA-binding transcriptional regulator YiaG